MKISLVAVGTKMPAWVVQGTEEYRKRLPRDFELKIIEIPLSQRSKTTDLKKAMVKEGEASLQAVAKGDYVVALDVPGKSLSTENLAQKIKTLRESGQNLTLLVGGPDGLAPECLQRADASWSLSALTMPHPIVRVVIAEQIYRVWSLLKNHPYHRA